VTIDAETVSTVSCEPCGRQGRYNGERLIAALGADVILHIGSHIGTNVLAFVHFTGPQGAVIAI
jgi:hypothetical protein